MKIYTKKGDTGETSLLGGTRVPKSHLRIESYGTVDELNSWIGRIRNYEQAAEESDFLKEIQDTLFTVGSHLANDPGKSSFKLPEIPESAIEELESSMDKMNEVLPELKSFVLPGGHPANADAHLARCVCRRAERHVVALNRVEPVSPVLLKYLNRLSDWLFVFSRMLSHRAGAEEVKWAPRS